MSTLRFDHSHRVQIEVGPRPGILLIKLATLGDLLLATPALRALRRRYPQARIDVLTTPEAAQLLQDSPLVDHVYTADIHSVSRSRKQAASARGAAKLLAMTWKLRRTRYDAAILAHHLTLPGAARKYQALLAAIAPRRSVGLDNGRGGFLDIRVPDLEFGARHEAEYALELAAALDAPSPMDDRDLRIANLGWPEIAPQTPAPGQPPLVAVHPGSGSYSIARRWPAERFAEVAAALHTEHDARVLLVGGAEERELVETVATLVGRPSWVTAAYPATPRALAEMLSGCALFIGNDSFPMHMAAAAGVPVVAVFGPSNARAWGPYAPHRPDSAAVVRRDDLACIPCLYRGHALGTPQGCPPRMCLTLLGSQPVLAAARRLLGRKAARAVPAG